MSQPRTGGEKQIPSAFLDQQRDAVLRKLDGLTDDRFRQPVTSGGLYLLGLVEHLAGAEHYWLVPVTIGDMARLAGMDLNIRWADCGRLAFTGDSTKHVSVCGSPCELPWRRLAARVRSLAAATRSNRARV